jgi:hypothetical protein
MYSVAVSPALLADIGVDLDKANSAQRARALLPWLVRRGPAVRDLEFRFCTVSSGAPEADVFPFGLSAACLTAACMAAPLRKLYITDTPLSTLAFLPLVAGSLEELALDCVDRLQIDVSLGGMTRLTYLDLEGDIRSALPDVRLPPNLVHFVINSDISSDARLVSRLLSQV